MKQECTNKAIGIHLHAYEISALNEEMTEEFEIHLLSCQHCFETLQSFEQEATVLQHGAITRGQKTAPVKLSQWKSSPMFTSILAALLVLMIYPSFVGIKSIIEPKIKPLESITLVPVRSAEKNYNISQENDVVLAIVYTDSKPDYNYTIEIHNQENKILNLESFKNFDLYHTGRILIPKESLVTGEYLCILKDNENDTGKILQQYTFRIN